VERPQGESVEHARAPQGERGGLVDRRCSAHVDLGLFASVLGHIGDGNFHESIMYDATDPEQRKKVEACVYRMVERALEMEGTCTGEHGIGIGKKGSLVKELGVETIGVMQKLKSSLDPLWIMNPGKNYLPMIDLRVLSADRYFSEGKIFDPPTSI
jgi:FAD/FMN-containing dehydrogenase